MEALWLIIGILFGVCLSAIVLGICQLKRISVCEQAIRELKRKINMRKE